MPLVLYQVQQSGVAVPDIGFVMLGLAVFALVAVLICECLDYFRGN